MSIPKIIHYCWFGGNPLPPAAKKCIASWKRFCPEYKIIEWNETNYNVNACQFCGEMYKQKKWAFVSDYARLQIIFEHGGIYLDTDVELVKSLDPLLNCSAFMGIDTTYLVATGLGFGAVKGHPFLEANMKAYESINIFNEPPLNSYVTTELFQNCDDFDAKKAEIQQFFNVTIFPPEYFCAKHTHTGEISITPNTYSIHHFSLSWNTKEERKKTQARWRKYRIERIKNAPKILLRKMIGDERVESLKRFLHRK